MSKALRSTWQGILDAYGELFPAVGMNLLWLLLNFPLVIVGLGAIQLGTLTLSLEEDVQQAVTLLFTAIYAVILVIGPNPASSGMHLFANRIAREERVEFGLFWEGFRRYFWRALALFGIGSGGTFLLIANALFYLRSDLLPLRLFGIVWLYGIVVWLAMLVYMMPLLIEQDDKRVRVVLRNSFFLALANVFPTIVVLIVYIVLVLVSLGLTLLIALLTGSVIAMISARLVQTLLEPYRIAAAIAQQAKDQAITSETPSEK